MNTHWMVTVRGETRECRKEGKEYVHVLNSAWRVDENDREIERIKRVDPK